jgi:hypothetical protein
MLTVLIYAAALVAVTVVAVRAWNRKYRGTKWAINLGRVSCPRCQNQLPIIRIPRTRQQLKWGGWTCGKCGCEVDKHGKEIAAGSGTVAPY